MTFLEIDCSQKSKNTTSKSRMSVEFCIPCNIRMPRTSLHLMYKSEIKVYAFSSNELGVNRICQLLIFCADCTNDFHSTSTSSRMMTSNIFITLQRPMRQIHILTKIRGLFRAKEKANHAKHRLKTCYPKAPMERSGRV